MIKFPEERCKESHIQFKRKERELRKRETEKLALNQVTEQIQWVWGNGSKNKTGSFDYTSQVQSLSCWMWMC